MENDVLAAVYRTYSREIYLYLYGLSHNRQLSEDLMQETFAKGLNYCSDCGYGNKSLAIQGGKKSVFQYLQKR